MVETKSSRKTDLESGIEFINGFAVDWSPFIHDLPFFHDSTKERWFEDLEGKFKYERDGVVEITGRYVVKSPASSTYFTATGKYPSKEDIEMKRKEKLKSIAL